MKTTVRLANSTMWVEKSGKSWGVWVGVDNNQILLCAGGTRKKAIHNAVADLGDMARRLEKIK